MRIKRSVTRFFAVLVVPAVSLAVVTYFGAYAIWGNRGRLEHRIVLMEKDGADPDLVEELARTQLMDGGPNQVAVPRAKR
jgi:hypothetical protein